MFDPGALPPLREVIARHGLAARHSLGQHFLLDRNLTDRIAREAGPLTGATVIEVGPGPGGLTRSLLATDAARVVAIERDDRCIAALAELEAAAEGRLMLVAGDALTTDCAALCRAAGGAARCVVVANLPYNIATPLLIRWLHQIQDFASLTLMFQKEVAERLTAQPGSKAYGRLSVLTQWLTVPRRLFVVPARAFVPPPKVESAVVRLDPRPAPLAPASLATLERVTAAAFGQRRKMLRASLKALGGDTAALLAAAGVAPTARAEELDVAGFCALARALDEASSGDGAGAS
ncbi:MAG TPA: 16S rRNA (adenine(1518)-N(6)/adenine(1519)-N(6))-dimethyltransferase RsmA [Alphaproteobacteria bacterium]